VTERKSQRERERERKRKRERFRESDIKKGKKERK
jgi:hypothetical protein